MRIRALLTESVPRPLTALLPAPNGEEGLSQSRTKQRRRSALCSVFSACLEPGKQGEVRFTLADSFGRIEVEAVARMEDLAPSLA